MTRARTKPAETSWKKRSRFWLGLFGLWGLFISGVFAGFVGSPGVIQALRLKSLLRAKQTQVAALEAEVERLEAGAERLEKSRAAQEREIRRVLGYAAGDELIFDFSATSGRADFGATGRSPGGE